MSESRRLQVCSTVTVEGEGLAACSNGGEGLAACSISYNGRGGAGCLQYYNVVTIEGRGWQLQYSNNGRRGAGSLHISYNGGEGLVACMIEISVSPLDYAIF